MKHTDIKKGERIEFQPVCSKGRKFVKDHGREFVVDSTGRDGVWVQLKGYIHNLPVGKVRVISERKRK